MKKVATIQQGLCDRFLDALDHARHEGRLAEVVVPRLAVDLAGGQRFGELTRTDLEALTRHASTVGRRRAGVIVVMWQDMQQRRSRPDTFRDRDDTDSVVGSEKELAHGLSSSQIPSLETPR